MDVDTAINEDEICLTGEQEDISSPLLLEEAEGGMYVDVDKYILYVGEYGRYQILIQFLIMITGFPTAYPALMFYYIGHGPMWKCNPTAEYLNSTCTNNTALYEHSNTARCHMNRTFWTYEDLNKSTIVTDFDLVCDRSWLDALSGSVVFIGWGVGIVLMGYLSDHYGRKRVMYPCLGLTLVCLLMHAFVNNIWLLIVLRFFMGLFYSAPALNAFVLLMELVGSKYRVLATTIVSFSWPIGSFLLTLKAYYIDDWRTLCILCSAPYLLVILTIICVPESVRWLNMKGRKREAEAILKRAARINKKVLPPLLTLKPFKSTDSIKASYLDLFRRCGILKLVVAQGFIWFHVGMTYYAMSWEFADIGGDMYINYMLSFLVEIPGNFLVMFTLQIFGRKKMTIIFSALTALSCLGVSCTPKTNSFKVFRLALGLIGKGTISCLFACIYMWSSEIYSTVARTQGMAINVVTSRIGAACSPFIKILNELHPAGSFLLMTITSVIATLFCVLLPETVNKPTRETLEDMISPIQPVEMPIVFNINADVVYLNETSDNQSAPYLNLVNEINEEYNDNDLLLKNMQDL